MNSHSVPPTPFGAAERKRAEAQLHYICKRCWKPQEMPCVTKALSSLLSRRAVILEVIRLLNLEANMTSSLRPHQPPCLGHPFRARVDAVLTMCGDVTQRCDNVPLFITRRQMEKPFAGTQRETHSLYFPPIKERRCKHNQTRRQHVGVHISSERNILRVNVGGSRAMCSA